MPKALSGLFRAAIFWRAALQQLTFVAALPRCPEDLRLLEYEDRDPRTNTGFYCVTKF